MKKIFVLVRGLFVEIINFDDFVKIVIVVKEQFCYNCYVEVIEVKFDGKDEIVVSLIKDIIVFGKLVVLLFCFKYCFEVGYVFIYEVMENCNNYIKEFYWCVWFGDEKFDFDVFVISKFDGGKIVIISEVINDFVYVVGNIGEVFVDRFEKIMYVFMDFVIVVGWKVIIKFIFFCIIDGDLFKFVYFFNVFCMMLGVEFLKKGDEVYIIVQINVVIN